MMKLWILSDLHQEFLLDPEASKHPATRFDLAANRPDDVDCIIIAGDLDVSLLASLRRIDSELGNSVPVVYVPGNHDFYTGQDDHFTLADMKVQGQELAEFFGINLLQNDSIVIDDDVRIIGSTLWTDFESVGRGMLRSKTTEAEGRDGMNDYRMIKRESTAKPGQRKRIRAQDTIAEHKAARAYIERTLQQPHDGETIVVTHHAPHPRSLDPRHERLNYAYASNFATLFSEPWAPDVWVHGHIHRAVDYQVEDTRVLSNPRGYQFEPSEQNNGFQADMVLELGEHAPRMVW